MYKPLVLACVLCVVIVESRPSWQYLPAVPGYVPVYIRNGDTPLEEINPELAEAFHALPAGRSAGKHLDAAPESEHPDVEDEPQPELPEPIDTIIKNRPEKKILEKKSDITSASFVNPEDFR